MQIFAEACRCVFLIYFFQKMRKLKEVVLHSFPKVAVYGCFLTSKSMLFYSLSPLPPTKHPLEGGWLMSCSVFLLANTELKGPIFPLCAAEVHLGHTLSLRNHFLIFSFKLIFLNLFKKLITFLMKQKVIRVYKYIKL